MAFPSPHPTSRTTSSLVTLKPLNNSPVSSRYHPRLTASFSPHIRGSTSSRATAALSLAFCGFNLRADPACGRLGFPGILAIPFPYFAGMFAV
jgi:hypothetical protein